jgi:hypothetical protein
MTQFLEVAYKVHFGRIVRPLLVNAFAELVDDVGVEYHGDGAATLERQILIQRGPDTASSWELTPAEWVKLQTAVRDVIVLPDPLPREQRRKRTTSATEEPQSEIHRRLVERINSHTDTVPVTTA